MKKCISLCAAHAANAGVKADSHFEGRGVLYVKGLGTMLIFR